MSKNIKLRKGLDINLAGKAEARLEVAPMAKSYAVSPLDYENVTPKLLVKVGDKVEAGSALFFDKNNPRILFTSPVSGVVSAINRGEKRKLLSVAVEPDQQQVAKAIKLLDSDPYFDGVISELYQDFGDFEMALQYAQAAHQADSTDTDFQFDLIGVYEELNRWDDALQLADKMVEQNPDMVGAHATRADIYFNMQEYAKAIEDYSTAIALLSSNHYLRFKRGYSYLLNNDTTKAHKDFQRNLQDAEGEIEQVFAMIQLGMTEQARTAVDSILLADSIYQYER